MTDDGRPDYEAHVNAVTANADQAQTLEDAVAACQELRLVLDRMSSGITPGGLAEPYMNDMCWEAALKEGILCAIAAIDDILTSECDALRMSTRLRGPIAIARYTLSQTTTMLRV